MPRSLPTLSILTSHGSNEKLETCLAAGFFPKEGEVSLYTGDNVTPENHTVENAAMSAAGTYYYAAFSKDGIKTCAMKDVSLDKNDVKRKYS